MLNDMTEVEKREAALKKECAVLRRSYYF